MSLGRDRVRAAFNPSGDSIVDQLKTKTAELIDMCDAAKNADPHTKSGKEKRYWALAQTAYEEAAMWAVKAATTGK